MERFLRTRPPVGNPVNSGRGISEPVGQKSPVAAQPSAANRTKPPRIMPPPPTSKPGQVKPGGETQRANSDDITQPSAPGEQAAQGAPGGETPNQTGNAPNQTIPVKPDGKARPIAPGGAAKPAASPMAGGSLQPTTTGVETADQVAQIAATPIEGQELPGSGLAQGMPGEGVPLNATGQPMTSLEQGLQLQGEAQAVRGDTSGFLSGMDAAKQQEDLRKAQPSKIPAVPQGTYERVVKESYKSADPSGAPLTKQQQVALREDAHKQLEEYGEYPGKGDPKAPHPPIRPGRRSFNPFSGKFTGENGPNAFQLAGFDWDKSKAEFFKTGGRGPKQ